MLPSLVALCAVATVVNKLSNAFTSNGTGYFTPSIVTSPLAILLIIPRTLSGKNAFLLAFANAVSIFCTNSARFNGNSPPGNSLAFVYKSDAADFFATSSAAIFAAFASPALIKYGACTLPAPFAFNASIKARLFCACTLPNVCKLGSCEFMPVLAKFCSKVICRGSRVIMPFVGVVPSTMRKSSNRRIASPPKSPPVRNAFATSAVNDLRT